MRNENYFFYKGLVRLTNELEHTEKEFNRLREEFRATLGLKMATAERIRKYAERIRVTAERIRAYEERI